MDINAGSTMMTKYTTVSSSNQIKEETESNPITPAKPLVKESNRVLKSGDKELTRDEMQQITEGLNQFMETINTDLKFSLHEKTDRLIVQVVDTENQHVIKEFPPHELLDTLGAIKDYVGVLLDKRV